MTDNLVADLNRSLRRLSAGLVLGGHYDAAREIAQIAATDEPADNEPSTGDLTRMADNNTLITKALRIVERMGDYAVWPSRKSSASGAKGRCITDREHAELLQLLTDLDGRESVVQPSRRAAHGLKPKRRKAK